MLASKGARVEPDVQVVPAERMSGCSSRLFQSVWHDDMINVIPEHGDRALNESGWTTLRAVRGHRPENEVSSHIHGWNIIQYMHISLFGGMQAFVFDTCLIQGGTTTRKYYKEWHFQHLVFILSWSAMIIMFKMLNVPDVPIWICFAAGIVQRDGANSKLENLTMRRMMVVMKVMLMAM